MAPDGPIAPTSTAPTPYFTPLPSGMNTPGLRSGNSNEFLATPTRREVALELTYVAGSRALDSLAKFIASVESFFHPSNSGFWTEDVRTLS
jgi:proteasome activator subunit 4